MRQTPYLLLSTFAAHLVLAGTVHAQTKTGKTEERGWGSSWTAPVTDEQHRTQQFINQCDALEKAKDFQGMVDVCTRELRQKPDYFPACAIRAGAYVSLKKYDQALADANHAKETVDRKGIPTAMASMLMFRAKINTYRQDYRATTDDLRAALKLDRSSHEALNSLAWMLATAPDGAFRNGREAVALAKKALATAPDNQSYATIDTLAAAHAEANDYPRAVETENRAMEAARKEVKDAAKLAKFQQEATDRLHLFEQRRPYRLKEAIQP